MFSIGKKLNIVVVFYVFAHICFSNLEAMKMMKEDKTIYINNEPYKGEYTFKNHNLNINNATIDKNIFDCNGIFAKHSTFDARVIVSSGKISTHHCIFHHAPIIEACDFFSLYNSKILNTSNTMSDEMQISVRATNKSNDSIISINIENTTIPRRIPLKIFLSDNAALFFCDQNIYNDIFITIAPEKKLNITFARCTIKGNVYIYQEEANEYTPGCAAVKLKYSTVSGKFHFWGYKSGHYSIEKLVRN